MISRFDPLFIAHPRSLACSTSAARRGVSTIHLETSDLLLWLLCTATKWIEWFRTKRRKFLVPIQRAPQFRLRSTFPGVGRGHNWFVKLRSREIPSQSDKEIDLIMFLRWGRLSYFLTLLLVNLFTSLLIRWPKALESHGPIKLMFLS